MNNNKTTLKEGLDIVSNAINKCNKNDKNLKELKLERDELKKKMKEARKELSKHNSLNVKSALCPLFVVGGRVLPYVLIPAVLGGVCLFSAELDSKPKEKYPMLTTSVDEQNNKTFYQTFEHKYKKESEVEDNLVYMSKWYKSDLNKYERYVKTYSIPETNVEEVPELLKNVKGQNLDLLYTIKNVETETSESIDEKNNKEVYLVNIKKIGDESILYPSSYNVANVVLVMSILGLIVGELVVTFYQLENCNSIRYVIGKLKCEYEDYKNALTGYNGLKETLLEDKKRYRGLLRELKK